MAEALPPRPIISAEQVANYVVCPEAWRLKYLAMADEPRPTTGTKYGRDFRRNWFEQQDLSASLRSYAKVVYLLLVLLVIVVFMLEHRRTQALKRVPEAVVESEEVIGGTGERGLNGIDERHDELDQGSGKAAARSRSAVPTEIVLLLLILGLIIFMWDLLDRKSVKLHRSSGLDDKTKVVSLRVGDYLPAETLHSDSLGLTSRPDATVEEDGFLIPVDIKPLTNKVRDRHVVAVLLHLKLIEAAHKKRPPYGILLMGKDKRLVRVKNTEEKQRWLQSLLDEMRSITQGVPAVPAPAPNKCRNCDVRHRCEHSAYKA